jgi:hypothetical protein
MSAQSSKASPRTILGGKMKSDKPDPLAAFRRKPVEGGSIPAKEAETYAAFGGKDRIERLQIRRVLDPTRAPRYLHLYDIAFDGHFGTNFVLFYDFMVVKVRGKNLQGLVAALQNGTVEFIQEYHPDVWDKPAEDAALIESIEIVVQGEQAETAKSGGKKH